eukprot:Nk52_evm46s2340 gene=Nk52_evmTU46s2340
MKSGDKGTKTIEVCGRSRDRGPICSLRSSSSSRGQKSSGKSPATQIFTNLTTSAIFFFVVLGTATFYTLETSMVVYLVQMCNFSSPTANAIVNLFLAFHYCGSVVGGFLADEKYGKWRVASATNIIYCVGLAIVFVSSLPCVWEDFDHFQPGVPSLVLFFVGITCVAVANCSRMVFVSMLADQMEFVTGNDPDAMKSVFLLQSLAVNGGVVVSLFGSPLLQTIDEKFNPHLNETIGVSFYWSFAVSLACIVVATVYFFVLRKIYYNIDKPSELEGYENKGGVITQIYHTIVNGRSNKKKAKSLYLREKSSASRVLAFGLPRNADLENKEIADSEKEFCTFVRKETRERTDAYISVSSSCGKVSLRPYQANTSLLEYCDPMYSGLAKSLQDSMHIIVMMLVYGSLFNFIGCQCFSSVLIQAT